MLNFTFSFLFITSCFLVFGLQCLASQAATQVPKLAESPAPVVLSPTNQPTFKPSSQVNYDETVTIQAPPPEEEAPKAIPVKRFQWLNIQSKPLNPAQQNR